MHRRVALVVLTLLFTTTVFGKDVFLSVSGKANGFFTDARILNPSDDKDITVTARYLPAGNGDNSGAASVQITVPKRSMRVFDDAVQSIFGALAGGTAVCADMTALQALASPEVSSELRRQQKSCILLWLACGL